MSAMIEFVGYYAHVIFGFAGYAAGVVALMARKGSEPHVQAGRVFAWFMLVPVVVSSLLFMFGNPNLLAVLMSLAMAYLIISAVMSIRNTHPLARLAERALIVIPIVIALFAAFQPVRFFLAAPQESVMVSAVAPVLVASIFAGLAVGDIRVLINRPVRRAVWLKRHILRMLLAFAFATVAMLRIAMNIGLPFELTVILPLIAALLAAWYFCWRLDRADAVSSVLERGVPDPAVH